MCGCGRTSIPRPAGRRAGPNSSTKMNGPTIVRCRPGSVRLTLKSPRSWVTGVIDCRTEVSTVATWLSRSGCSDRQRMDSRLHQVAERGIDHPLAFEAVLFRERRALDAQGEMAFACRIVTAVPAMLLAVVDEFDQRRRKRRVEAGEHFSRHRSAFSRVHAAYIMGFDGKQAIQDARAGRGGAGAVRGPRLRRARRIQGAASASQFRRARRLALSVSRPRP